MLVRMMLAHSLVLVHCSRSTFTLPFASNPMSVDRTLVLRPLLAFARSRLGSAYQSVRPFFRYLLVPTLFSAYFYSLCVVRKLVDMLQSTA